MISRAVATLALLVAFVAASPISDDPQRCNGWFDAAAGACDSIGD